MSSVGFEELYQRLSPEDRDQVDIDRVAFGTAAIVVLNGIPRRVHPNDVYYILEKENRF